MTHLPHPLPGAAAYDEYESDPDKPVPFTSDISNGMTKAYMTDDQRRSPADQTSSSTKRTSSKTTSRSSDPSSPTCGSLRPDPPRTGSSN